MDLVQTAPDAARVAGVAIVAAASATVIGAVTGGLYGAGAGLLLAGAGVNAWRAQSNWSSTDATVRGEAAKSATMAVFGLGIGGFLAYKAVTERRSAPVRRKNARRIRKERHG